MDLDKIQQEALRIQNIYNISGIALFVISTISVFIALISYLYSKKSAKKFKSCELAKYYADYILPKTNYISNVFNLSKLGSLLKELFKPEEIHDFDYNEMTRLLGNKYSEKEITNKIQGINPEHLLSVRLFLAKNNTERNEILSSYISKVSDEASVTIDKSSLNNEFSRLITELLNELEWFSMHFTYKLADERLVYQSLHQTFISNVQVLYFYISRINKSTSEKFFTNIIQLYGTWYKCKVNQQKKQRSLERILLRRGKPL